MFDKGIAMREVGALLFLLFALAVWPTHMASGATGATPVSGATGPASGTAGATPVSRAATAISGEVRAGKAGGAAEQATHPYTATLDGKIVHFELSGFEPDFDRIDRLIFSISLHNGQHRGTPVPATMLVLSAYLENFQPDTTPVLPDLLHPNQTAQNLGGFMQGKAALVNAAGHTVYQGSMLSEVFLDNTAHLVLDLQPVSGGANAPDFRMQGLFTLHKDLSVHGSMWSPTALTRAQLASLRVPQGRAVSWQSVTNGMDVQLPPMMGTAGNGSGAAATPTPVPVPRTPLTVIAGLPAGLRVAGGAVAAVVLLGLVSLLLRLRRIRRPKHIDEGANA